MKSPSSSKVSLATTVTPPGGAPTGGSGGKGHRRSRSKGGSDSVGESGAPTSPARRGAASGGGQGKGTGQEQGQPKIESSETTLTDDTVKPDVSLTPSRRTSASSSGLTPHAIAMAMGGVPMETSLDIPMDTHPFPATDPLSPLISTGDIPMEIGGIDGSGLGGPLAAQSLDMIPQASSLTGSLFGSGLGEPSMPPSQAATSAAAIASQATSLSTIQSSPPDILIKQEASVKQEPCVKREPPVKQESAVAPSQPVAQTEPLMDAVVMFCREALGRGAVGLGELKDKLLLKQTSVEVGHPLREQAVSEAMLEAGLRKCGAMEVGQPLGKRLFALTHEDKVSCYI